MLKPFVFLDYFNAPVQAGFGFGMHPHSGIATLTWQPACDVRYQDTTGQSGVLRAGGLEWMNSGGGAWHQGQFDTDGHALGFQLWVSMPAVIEDGPAQGLYIPPEEVPAHVWDSGKLQVLLGQWHLDGQVLSSAIPSHQDMHYGVLTLSAGATWVWHPPSQHDVCWVFPFEGLCQVQDQTQSQGLLVMGAGDRVSLRAGAQGARILLGSAKQHPHALVTGPYSVHTNQHSLASSMQRIEAMGKTLALPSAQK